MHLLREKILKSGKGRDWVKKFVLPYQLSTQDTIAYPYTSRHRRAQGGRTITFLPAVKQKPPIALFQK